MDKYKRLVSNTILTAINQFSSKVLTLLMAAYYMRRMAPEEYGAITAVQTVGGFLLPLVLLGIQNAIVRFGLERGTSKKQVYTNGLLALGMGYACLLALWPLLYRVPFIANTVKGYSVLLLFFLLTSCLNTLNCQFTRAQQRLRLYAIDGILNSALTLGFTVLFIGTGSPLRIIPDGLLLAIICGDYCSALFLFATQRLWQYIDLKRINWKLFKDMLRFSLPLISASVFWSLTNSSDQIFVINILGDSANGILSACYKVPTLLTIVATLFTEAWQISAYTDGARAGRETFFSRVFGIYQSIMFMAAAGIVWLAKWLMLILGGRDFAEAWVYIPLFTFATVFNSLSNFLNSIYMTEKRSGLSLATMSVGAVQTLVLHGLLIPLWGIQGAAMATFVSYFVVFVLRAVNTRGLLRVNFSVGKMALNLAILTAESVIQVTSDGTAVLWTTLLTALMVALNFKSLWEMARRLLRRGKKV